jgi:hypothetical protein
VTADTDRWANISWEFLFGVVYPNSVAHVVVFVPWLLIDVGIVYATCKFGPDQLKNSPLVAKNLSWIMAIGIPFTMIMFWTLIKTVGTDEASFYIAFSDQLLVSSLSVAHLLKRGNTSGHSLAIWCVTFLTCPLTCSILKENTGFGDRQGPSPQLWSLSGGIGIILRPTPK